MKTIIALASLVAVAYCGVISHETTHDEFNKATSYQSINFEHFAAVPTYVKKEDAHLLEHPIQTGKTSAKVKVHHGDKHHQGYAIADSHSTLEGHHHAEEPTISVGGHGHSDDSNAYAEAVKASEAAHAAIAAQSAHSGLKAQEYQPKFEPQSFGHNAYEGHSFGEEQEEQDNTKLYGGSSSGLGLGHYH